MTIKRKSKLGNSHLSAVLVFVLAEDPEWTGLHQVMCSVSICATGVLPAGYAFFRPFKSDGSDKTFAFSCVKLFYAVFLMLCLHFSLACCQAVAVVYSPCFPWHFVLFVSSYGSTPPEQHYYSHSSLPLLILCISH